MSTIQSYKLQYNYDVVLLTINNFMHRVVLVRLLCPDPSVLGGLPWPDGGVLARLLCPDPSVLGGLP